MADIEGVLRQVLPVLVERELKRLIAAYPLPSDGRDGAPGADGKDGAPGAPGLPGADGKDGAPGRDGRGIETIEIIDGVMIVRCTDKMDIVVGKVVGDTGPRGESVDPTAVAILVQNLTAAFQKRIEQQDFEIATLRKHLDALDQRDVEMRALVKGILSDE